MTLAKAILEALDSASDAPPLSAKGIYGLIAGDVHPRPLLGDIERECERLAAAHEIVSLRDPDRGIVHSITPKGQARARK